MMITLTAERGDEEAIKQLAKLTAIDRLLICFFTGFSMNDEQGNKYRQDINPNGTIVIEEECLQITGNGGSTYLIGLIPIEDEDEIAPTIDADDYTWEDACPDNK